MRFGPPFSLDPVWRSRKIVVTGAAGFIGSCLVRYLNDLGCEKLILVDNLKSGEKWKNLLGKRYEELLPKEQLFSWLQGRESELAAFFHLGACSDTLETDGDYILENNYRYTVRLAEYALKHGQKFIYASSASTYGDGALGFADDHDLLDELRPLNLYGFSKHLFDLWAKRQGVLSQLIGLKFFNVFGPNEFHKGRMASMVYKMLPPLQEKGLVQLFASNEPERFGDGEQSRDFVYVKDVVRLTTQFLDTPAVGGIYNIGSGSATSWNRLAKALCQAVGVPARIEYIPMPAALSRQYQNYTCAPMSKCYQALYGTDQPAQPGYTPEAAVAECVTSYLLPGGRW